MDYKAILKELKPNKEEKEAVHKTAQKLIKYINEICKKENIPGTATLVGSVAKGTWLSGKSDIDIFISFPLETDIGELKETGLYLGYKTTKQMNGTASENYASHPYITSNIDGFEVDFVPCYKIENGNQLKSAVDRTILHTKYILANLKEEQKDEVLLLKKFMDCIGTYGSEFKTGGFAGYLCELLILEYNTFENLLKEAQSWNYKTIIDLENYKTEKEFNDPLIAIDPTDKNRNVGAALKLERMIDFIIGSRNLLKIINNKDLNENEKEEIAKSYFKPLTKNKIVITPENIIQKFKDRETEILVLKFNIPEISADALYPQLNKTEESLTEKLEAEEFSVFKSDYWTNEKDLAVFIFEMNVAKLGKYKIHEGPKIWSQKACNNFQNKWKDVELYPLNEFLVFTREREFKTAKSFIEHTLIPENIHIIKVGKNIKTAICNTYELKNIKETINTIKNEDKKTNENNLDKFLNFLDDFLNPGQYLKR